MQALADAGLNPSEVVIQQRATVANEGFIVAQDPLAGTNSPQKIILFLPTPANTPELAGKAEPDGRNALEELGPLVSVKRQYQAGTAAGTVIGTEPKGGKTHCNSALIVASEPAKIMLATLKREGGCSSDRAAVNGNIYYKSVVCRAQENPSEVIASRWEELGAHQQVPNHGVGTQPAWLATCGLSDSWRPDLALPRTAAARFRSPRLNQVHRRIRSLGESEQILPLDAKKR